MSDPILKSDIVQIDSNKQNVFQVNIDDIVQIVSKKQKLLEINKHVELYISIFN